MEKHTDRDLTALVLLRGETIVNSMMDQWGIITLTTARGLQFRIIPSLIKVGLPTVAIACGCRECISYLGFGDGGDCPPVHCHGCHLRWDTLDEYLAWIKDVGTCLQQTEEKSEGK